MEKIIHFKIQNDKKESNHDKTLFRLIDILQKISNDELPTTKELSNEYNVSVRTIQKDISTRLCGFPIERTKDNRLKFTDGYGLDKTELSKDEMILLQLSLSQFNDVTDFDKISHKLYNKLLTTKFINPYFIKQEDIQDIDIDSILIEELELAITNKKHVILKCKHHTQEVEPYKIVSYDGIWYLFGKDEDDKKIKTFLLSNIKKTITLPKPHTKDSKDIEKILSQTHSAWYDDGTRYKVKVKVDSCIAHFFLQKDFLSSQNILETLSNGDLIIEFEITHDEDIDNIIKSWLPNIEVLEPKIFRDKIKKELENYLKRF